MSQKHLWHFDGKNLKLNLTYFIKILEISTKSLQYLKNLKNLRNNFLKNEKGLKTRIS